MRRKSSLYYSWWWLASSMLGIATTTAFVVSSSPPSSCARMSSSRTFITTNTLIETVDTSAQYTPEQLKQALQNLLDDSDNPAADGAHLYVAPDEILSKLQEITATVCLDYNNYQQLPTSPSLQHLEEAAKVFAQTHGPLLSLQQVIQQQAPTMALAAEFKRASPSKGRMAPENTSAAEQGMRYAHAGANILSVLTEPRWFQGSLQDLTDIRLATNDIQNIGKDNRQRPAILRKDFVINEYMIAQAAAAGGDTVLLIVAVLPLHLLQRLMHYARDTFQMEPLVEVHTTDELKVALQAGARVIGVNNRNLHTFQMDLQTSERMAAFLQKEGIVYQHGSPYNQQVCLCALSGMSNAMDVHRYRQVGIGMCLIGESLMRASDPVAAIQNLCLHPEDWEAQTNVSSGSIAAYTAGTQIVKVCGITNSHDALKACQSGANLIGIIFAEKSPRKVTSMEQAKEIVQTVRQFGERSSRLEFPATTATFSNPLLHLTQQARILAQTATPQRPAVVGVFQNQSSEYIRSVCEQAGLDVIQLHGSEGMAAANRDLYNGVPVLRVVDIPSSSETHDNSDSPIQTLLQSLTNDPMAILLDTAVPGQQGGTGKTFDWQLALELQNQGLPVLVAGGLTPDNVADCVASTRPFGVDVSSGVEASKGIKDHVAVEQFLQQSRQAARDANRGF
ncbi:anthranilate synthase / indole-3-glycerol phosphate synthase / phosphoribosylanthranilate isomerase [Fistulifera solaris]|uniref:Anthranilate synthase / indole-3-glycerol phosphate synthase / phosphoribosylanthranilate isomerase n=1 Tax=Fistulifera solaris TaxID=1519565 RepID=A0A1Z5JHZ2_FISSO|nr:anthranilate synthase / indole-3-glycerol phosphate synthase / phosphoribosylanthranilate isomerase [Fistulifera solaris]|eukprot:GAX13630.1 anthranilate synthase / indole-3-glycerol phosphate synthase / phosphoribosylanthranilate isomerase [Fistulifera solaris]